MLYQRIERLITEMAKYPEISASISKEGITVQVTGNTTVSRTFPLLKVAVSNTNNLTTYLNDMREEAGGLRPRNSIRDDLYYLKAIKRHLDEFQDSVHADNTYYVPELALEALADECDWLDGYIRRIGFD